MTDLKNDKMEDKLVETAEYISEKEAGIHAAIKHVNDSLNSLVYANDTFYEKINTLMVSMGNEKCEADSDYDIDDSYSPMEIKLRQLNEYANSILGTVKHISGRLNT